MLGKERTYKNINPIKECLQNLYGSWYEKRLLVMRPASFSFSLSCCEAFLLSLRLNFLFSKQITQNIYMTQQHAKFFTCSQLNLKKDTRFRLSYHCRITFDSLFLFLLIFFSLSVRIKKPIKPLYSMLPCNGFYFFIFTIFTATILFVVIIKTITVRRIFLSICIICKCNLSICPCAWLNSLCSALPVRIWRENFNIRLTPS